MTADEKPRSSRNTLGHMPLTPDGAPRDESANVVLQERRGKLVWRVAKRGGADLGRPPMDVAIARTLKEFKSGVQKAARTVRASGMQAAAAKKGAARKREIGTKTRDRVLELAVQHANIGRNLAGFIARKMRLSARRVRQILKMEKRK